MAEWVDITHARLWATSVEILFDEGDPYNYYIPAEWDGTKWLWLDTYQERRFNINYPAVVEASQFRLTFQPGSESAYVNAFTGVDPFPYYGSVYDYTATSPQTLDFGGTEAFWGFSLDQRYNAGDISKIEIYTDQTIQACTSLSREFRIGGSDTRYIVDYGDWTRSVYIAPEEYYNYFSTYCEAGPITLTYTGSESTAGKTLYLEFEIGVYVGTAGDVEINGEVFAATNTFVRLTQAIPWTGNQITIDPGTNGEIHLYGVWVCGDGESPLPTSFWTNFVGQDESCL